MTRASDSKNWTLYVLQTVDDFYYTGITTDLERRLKEHFSQGKKSARYLKAHPPKKLVFNFTVEGHSLALKAEYHFKKLPRQIKIRTIQKKTIQIDPDTGKIRI